MLGKTVLITGASRGIGFAVTKKLVDSGYNVVALARKTRRLEDLFTSNVNATSKLKAYQCDVSSKDEVENTWLKISEEFPQIDSVILNAGVGFLVTPKTYSSEFAEKTFGVNLMGVIYLIEKVLPQMLERKSGLIAGVSSLADARGFSGSGFYCASKAALSTYLEGLRVELHHYGIKVITVKPGFVKTDMTAQNKFEMPFLMEPEKAAEIIMKGLVKGKRVIQFPLPTVLAIKLVKFMPDALYEFFAKRTKIV